MEKKQICIPERTQVERSIGGLLRPINVLESRLDEGGRTELSPVFSRADYEGGRQSCHQCSREQIMGGGQSCHLPVALLKMTLCFYNPISDLFPEQSIKSRHKVYPALHNAVLYPAAL